MLVFSVETSCDETSICILDDNKKIYSHIIHSQEDHGKYGGVIPEIASRAHLQILQKISREALNQANKKINDIDIFCATCGPGLIGGLLVGSIFTKGLAAGAKKPFIPINHLEGHLLSPSFNNKIHYPYITFLLTGGHTQLYLSNSLAKYELLGETLDDAIGEAFDKVAKLLGMNYPGGPEIERAAKKGNKKAFDLPHPLKKDKNLNFSFSGIKTAVNLIVKKEKNHDQTFKSNMAASFQQKIGEILKGKLEKIMDLQKEKSINISQVALVGGVAANKCIYEILKKELFNYNCELILPPKKMLSDNAAMIGWACIQKYSKSNYSDILFKENPRLTI